MLIEGTRFGRIEVPDDRVISIPAGLFGFPDDRAFVLHESAKSRRISWLQSVNSPNLAFPVMDGTTFGPDYPKPNAAAIATANGLAPDDLAVLVIVVARAQEPRICANLLAPLIIDIATRTGVQAVLDPRDYDPMFVVPQELLANPVDSHPPRLPNSAAERVSASAA